MLAFNRPILKIKQIQDEIKRNQHMLVSKEQVTDVFHSDLGLRYKRFAKVPIQANSERCLILRQKYALKMIHLLQELSLIHI